MGEDNKGLFNSFLFVGAGTIVSMIIGLITTPVITRLYSPEEYGQYSMFITYGDLTYIVLGMGMDQALARYYYEKKNNSYKVALIKRCIRIPFILSILVQIGAIVFFEDGKSLFGLNGIFVLCGAIYVAFLIGNRFLGIILRLENRTKILGMISVIQKVIFVLIAFGICIFSGSTSAISLCIGVVISQAVSMIVGIFGDKDILFQSEVYDSDIVSQKELIIYALPYVFSIAISSIFQALDRLFINRYCGYAEVGIYASAISIIHIFAIVQNSFTTVWMPNAIKRFSEKQNDRQYYADMSKRVTLLMFFLGVLLILFKDFIVMLLGEKYRDAVGIIPFLTFMPIMYTISETTVIGLVFMKRSNLQIIPPSIACIVNGLGNYILVPILGGKGAAISTGVSYIVFFYARTFLSSRCYSVDYDLNRLTFVTVLMILYATFETFVCAPMASVFLGLVIEIILVLAYKKVARDIILFLDDILKKVLKIGNM